MIFSGHIAIVTGGRGALGGAIVHRFLESGAAVAVPVRPGTPPGGTGSISFEAPCDVTDEEDVRRFVKAVRDAHGEPDILVHAAGGYEGGMRIEETPVAVWDAMQSGNLRSAFLFCREVLPAMRQKGWGRVVFVSAYSAIRVGAGSGAYAVSKRGLLTLMDVLAEEVKGTGVTVNTIAPSILRTAANRQSMPDADEHRWVPVGDVASAILTLCSPESGAISGTAVTMRGGV